MFERYQPHRLRLYKSANLSGIILVNDITKRLTFQNIEEWLNELRQQANPELVFLLVGNKMDLYSLREVSKEEGQQFTIKNGILFFETSSLDSTSAEKGFLIVVKDIYYKMVAQEGAFTSNKYQPIPNGGCPVS